MPLQFECRKIALKQDRTGYVLTVSLHPDEIPEELLRDFVGSRYACALVKIKDDESPTNYENRVKQAGMLCRNANFQDFLFANYRRSGEVLSENWTASTLCKLCQIDSRSELNGNKDAQQLFDDLMAEYTEWKPNATPF